MRRRQFLIRLQPRRIGVDQRAVQDIGVAVEGLRVRGLAGCEERIYRSESGVAVFVYPRFGEVETRFDVFLVAGEALANLVFGRGRIFVSRFAGRAVR